MRPLADRRHAFAIVIGLTDGILTALTLAANDLVEGQRAASFLALRVAVGSAVCGIFVFFTAEYARLRSELLHAERQLNLTTRGVFASRHLGIQIRKEALGSAALSSASNFLGAFFPLLIGEFLHARYLALLPPVLTLAVLGAALAYTIQGRYVLWVISLAAAGVVFSWIGIVLHIA